MSVDGNAIKLRTPCKSCGYEMGIIRVRGGQNTVYCECGQYAGYNAPKAETGEATRSLRDRPDIKPSQRARILLRDGQACILCHRADRDLHIGHLISIADACEYGFDDELIHSDWNLATFCDEDNVGLGASTVAVTLMYRCLKIATAQHGQ